MLPIPLQALLELGPRSVGHLALYKIAVASGWARARTPAVAWNEQPLAAWLRPGLPAEPAGFLQEIDRHAGGLFPPAAPDGMRELERVLGPARDKALDEAQAILDGAFTLFGRPYRLGFPPNWQDPARQNASARPPDVACLPHWTRLRLEALDEDVKLIWEPSRFGWVFPLARAYFLTGEACYSEAFWELLDSWRAANPPNRGWNWQSGQEVAFRALALGFGLCAFRSSFQDEPERVATLLQTIAFHAARLPPTLSYASAQNNNHLLIEGLALLQCGLLLPMLKDADRWRRLGVSVVAQALHRQVFPDGGYIQQSTNYHRLALQAGLWAARLLEAQGGEVPETIIDPLRRMMRWLYAVVDPLSGAAPNFGPNDSAQLMPLSACPLEDFRPTVQAAARMTLGRPLYPPGAWDDLSLWLGLEVGRDADAGPPGGLTERPGDDFPDSGVALLRGERCWALLRAARFKTRPGHSDQMHFDLWRRGRNILCDPGTFSYNAPPPWDNALTGARCHNTLLLDGREPMRRAGRFLWLNWSRAQVVGRWRSESGRLQALLAIHESPRWPGLAHQRAVIRAEDDLWAVVDWVLGQGEHAVQLAWCVHSISARGDGRRWRFETPQGDLWLDLEAPEGEFALFRAGECIAGEDLGLPEELLGWRSPAYLSREPAYHYLYRAKALLPARIVTRWTFGDHDPSELRLQGEGSGPGLVVSYHDETIPIADAHPAHPSSVRRAL